MKVITLNGSLIRGHGVDTVISSFLQRVHANNPDISLELLCNEEEGLIEDGFPKDIRLTTLGKPKALGYHHLATLELAGHIHPDADTIIHIHHPVGTLPILFKKARKIATWHGNNNENWLSPDFGRVPKRVARRLLLDFCTHMFRSVDTIVTISDHLRNQLVNDYMIPKRKVERIHWGIDTGIFSPYENMPDQNRLDRYPQGYMLFVGRHVHYKNIGALIDLSKDLNYPLVCSGEGPERKRLEAYAQRVGADATFKGKTTLKELVQLYQQCAFYVTASKWEGFGLPPLEASACEKPAIVPRNTAHVELVENSRTGFIYDDLDGFRRAAAMLIQEPNMRLEMGKAARDHVKNKFSIDKVAEAYVSVYESLLN